MLTLTISDENEEIIDKLSFDQETVVYSEGKVAFVHRRTAPHRTIRELWARVAQAASWLALGKPLADERVTTAYYIVDDDCYRLERDPGEADADYRKRAKMLGCTDKGLVRIPRERPRALPAQTREEAALRQAHSL